MASTIDDNLDSLASDQSEVGQGGSVQWRRMLLPLASLKLTVTLFLLSIFIVLAGTFAQVHDDIWYVINEYFRVDMGSLFTSTFPFVNLGSLFVRIDYSLFFPEAFFPPQPVFPDHLRWMAPVWPDGTPEFLVGKGFWFPKGWTIGVVMAMNLVAAHTLRFKVQARGTRLIAGSGVLVVGSLFTYLVILSGSSPEGLQSKPLISYESLRLLMLTTLFGCCGVTVYGAIVSGGDFAKRWLNVIATVLLVLTAGFIGMWESSDAASMRILYQLVKATLASCFLLAGCIMVFKKRAGVVLLHAGIGLMMFYDVLVGTQHIESQMSIVEGDTVNFSRDIRDVELAIIDGSSPEEDQMTVVSSSLLRPETTITDERLPFDVEVLQFYRNSDVRGLRSFGPNEEIPENPATAGIGKNVVVTPVDNVKGTDTGGRVDVPSAYIRLRTKGEDGEDLGVYMVSSIFDLSPEPFGETQSVSVDGKTYEIALRFVRYYNDFSIKLTDVQKNDYKGTSQVKDYSSYITVTDPSRDLEFDHRIWMNNPMRFAGKTFYQSNYAMMEGGREMTTLQVVDNAGWMTPYVSCMIVWVGMMYHFSLTLLRYLDRRSRTTVVSSGASRGYGAQLTPKQNKISWAMTGVICLSILSSMLMLGRAPRESADVMHVESFSELPIWYKGRPMPIDSFARNMLLRLSDYETYRDEDGEKHSATKWLLQVMSNEVAARDLRVFKIENKDVIEALGLPEREKFTYSFNELLKSPKVDGIKEMGILTILRELEGLTEIDPQQPREFEVAVSDTPQNERTRFERKIIELSRKVDEYVLLEFTTGGGRIIDLMRDKELGDATQSQLIELGFKLREFDRLHSQAFNKSPIPLMVPTHFNAKDRPEQEAFQTEWESLTAAKIFDRIYDELVEMDSSEYTKPPAVKLFVSMVQAYEDEDVDAFNDQLKDYQVFLSDYARQESDPTFLQKTEFEAVYNRFDAFYQSANLYLFAGILAALGWLFLPGFFQRAAFWTLVTVFLIHTAALIGRICISGRPPVTNLYSSAIFIGWAVVLGSLILESISKLGAGNIVAAICGFLSLRIADGLANDGDTFVVLEAVLDTQFWLATHVVCITLGYATTYLAGFLGALYVFTGLFSKRLDKNVSKEFARMTYGVLCFATFFSFVGTVLGGLWADDSWGRFWGWDPKENGALIIVLWNALVLHARWGGMVKDRGLAMLTVLGNVVVSWSWFGVNELSVGLHSYGFTEGRLAWLILFCLSQVFIAMIACTPLNLWRSNPKEVSTT
ncbi:Cytochrome c biogenesis protein CcsA [Thalassoglobus neptunius]|uniref:Cytochrome c biogenesis protein CcsA n=1 Tax=Thalassoglobus neptunius TaxID=1938619 RepID=A0A5C5WPK2_9PLAN|nr:cytochrome c biogenesis protein CcsA [Thalassoglobus neptunius]TWT51943.1 Cytochrome c biogenesis protein CcsA [Thalassoglobus neptunius]